VYEVNADPVDLGAERRDRVVGGLGGAPVETLQVVDQGPQRLLFDAPVAPVTRSAGEVLPCRSVVRDSE
jgi:hypothetical protein